MIIRDKTIATDWIPIPHWILCRKADGSKFFPRMDIQNRNPAEIPRANISERDPAKNKAILRPLPNIWRSSGPRLYGQKIHGRDSHSARKRQFSGPAPSCPGENPADAPL